MPFSKLSRRPVHNQTDDKVRFKPKDKRIHRDIDE
jgi:hypothetical protein